MWHSFYQIKKQPLKNEKKVYSWVKKYDAVGEADLSDRRDRHKSNDAVDELERLRRKNIRL